MRYLLLFYVFTAGAQFSAPLFAKDLNIPLENNDFFITDQGIAVSPMTKTNAYTSNITETNMSYSYPKNGRSKWYQGYSIKMARYKGVPQSFVESIPSIKQYQKMRYDKLGNPISQTLCKFIEMRQGGGFFVEDKSNCKMLTKKLCEAINKTRTSDGTTLAEYGKNLKWCEDNLENLKGLRKRLKKATGEDYIKAANEDVRELHNLFSQTAKTKQKKFRIDAGPKKNAVEKDGAQNLTKIWKNTDDYIDNMLGPLQGLGEYVKLCSELAIAFKIDGNSSVRSQTK